MKVGNIWVSLKANTKQATSQMKKAFGGFKSMALNFAAGFGAFRFFKGAIDQANSLGEQMNALTVLFGEHAKSIDDFGKKASKTFGLSRTEALEYGNEFAGLLGKMGKGSQETTGEIIELEKRIADLGSFRQRDFKDIATGLQSALAGRAAISLQQLGIFLTQSAIQAQIAKGAFEEFGYGTDTVFQKLDEGAKVFLRLRSFMMQSKSSMGDFQKTFKGSFENQNKALKAQFKNIQIELGQKLLPHMIKIFAWLNDNLQNVINTLAILGGMFAGFKLGRFIGEMIKGIGVLMGFFAARVAAQTGIGAFAAVPAALATIGGIIGGVLGGVGLSMSGSSTGGGSDKQQQNPSNSRMEDFRTTIINVTPDGTSVSGNSNGMQVQTNYGGG